MLDESKVIKAKDIVEDPESVYGLMRSHVMIHDSSNNVTFSNLMDSVEIMVEAGWEVVSTNYSPPYMFIMMKNPNFKRKNRDLG
ncbi:MAG: hypothetical protein Phog2KO_41200 [Phototrophicaceae bacterium]